MDILAQLGVALGLASLAGVNLYLTVLLTGLAVRFNFVQLAAQYQSLDVLAHPLVIIVAGLLFVMQFFADKMAAATDKAPSLPIARAEVYAVAPTIAPDSRAVRVRLRSDLRGQGQEQR